MFTQVLGIRRRLLAAGTAAFAVALITGCGDSGNLGRVSGTVTLDGQPLTHATLIFSPLEAGSPSAARTDENGNYVLVYGRDVQGAEIGSHRVWISTQQSPDDSDPSRVAVPERVPGKYHLPSALTATVTKGRSTIDFALDSTADPRTAASVHPPYGR